MDAIIRYILLLAVVVAQQARTASGVTPGYTRAPESDDSPLYIPPDVSCAELRAFARDTASDGSSWFESGPLHCDITYHGTAESSTQGSSRFPALSDMWYMPFLSSTYRRSLDKAQIATVRRCVSD